MMRSWGCSSAVYTAKLAGEPECGCTLTPHSSGSRPYSASARSWRNVNADVKTKSFQTGELAQAAVEPSATVADKTDGRRDGAQVTH